MADDHDTHESGDSVPAQQSQMEQITQTRLAVLENGYVPLPNVDKRCYLKGWPKIKVTKGVIAGWRRMRRYEATGIRLDNGLAVIDLDLDIKAFEALARALVGKFPQLEAALRRTGKGKKQAWFVTTSEPFNRIAGPLFIDSKGDPEIGHMVETFGGGTPRYFGSLGWHTKDELKYSWLGNRSPVNTPLAELPELAKQEFFAITDFTTRWMKEHGYVAAGVEGGGETTPRRVFDLTDDMIFETLEDRNLNLEQVREIGEGRCSGSFCQEAPANNKTRCLISLDHDGGVSIQDTMTCITHHENSFGPTDTDEIGQDIANRLSALAAEAATPATELAASQRQLDFTLTRG